MSDLTKEQMSDWVNEQEQRIDRFLEANANLIARIDWLLEVNGGWLELLSRPSTTPFSQALLADDGEHTKDL